ncbi:MAG: hypothetical protein KJZ78_27755, partial [Bryobacteraceae bacterium]|nr:hypothetical protein [Bryobacteraceae bacterium]
MAVTEHGGQGGRSRFSIENEGFNVQKSSGVNLEHAHSMDWTKAKADYFLRRLDQLFFQLLEKGSLLCALAAEYGKTAIAPLCWAAKRTSPSAWSTKASLALGKRMRAK